MTLDRASPSELDDTQRETERVLSKLQDIITKWAPKVEQVRIQQEDKLHKTLTNFEQVAREHAEEAISRELRSLTLVGAILASLHFELLNDFLGGRDLRPW